VRIERIAVMVAALAALPGVAVAAEDRSPGKETLAAFPLGQEQCLAQDFSAKKDGDATLLMLYRVLRPNPSYEHVEDDAASLVLRDKALEYSVPVSVIARFKGQKGDFTQQVSCRDSDGQISCGVDCDGGGFSAERKGDSLALSFWEYGMTVQGGCGEDGAVTRMIENKHLPEPALLTPRAAGTCAEADRQSTLSFSRELVPLRERISAGGWTCLKRVYDKDHLKKNPAQMVTSLAVALKLNVGKTPEGYTDTSLKAVASLKLRDGTRAKKKLDCYAGRYDFACEEDFRLKRRSAKDALLISGAYEPEPGMPRKMMGFELGEGDDVFRLDASQSAACDAE
jgi:hypothetical protein